MLPPSPCFLKDGSDQDKVVIPVIYDNLLNTAFKQEDVIESSEEKLDDILSIDLNNMDEIYMLQLHHN